MLLQKGQHQKDQILIFTIVNPKTGERISSKQKKRTFRCITKDTFDYYYQKGLCSVFREAMIFSTLPRPAHAWKFKSEDDANTWKTIS